MSDKELSKEQAEPQPVYVLAPEYLDGPGRADEFDLTQYIMVLWRRKVVIIGATLIVGIAVFLISQILPKKWEATATLLVQPPSFSTELRPEPLSVEAFESIVVSGNVMTSLRLRLERDGIIEPEKSMGTIETELHPSRNREQVFRPIIDLVVRSDSPQKAVMIADAWAEVAVQEIYKLTNQGKEDSLDLIQKEYPVIKERLEEFEKQLKETEDTYDRRLIKRETYWENRIAAFNKTWNIESLKQQLTALERRQTENRVNLNDIQLQIKESQETLNQLKAEIEKHPQFLILSKAITDDVLWEKIGRDFSGTTSEELDKLKLRSEVTNPVHTRLLQRLADEQVKFETLVPNEKHLQDQLERLEKETGDLNALIIEKETELSQLQRGRDSELTLLKRERTFEVGRLKREVDSSAKAFENLSEKYEESRLAQSEISPDVLIGSRAATPENPASPRPLLNTAIALVLGFFFAIIGAFVLEFVQGSNQLLTRP